MKNLDKRDRQGVRTPSDLEQKYNLAALVRTVERLEDKLSRFIERADAVLNAAQETSSATDSTDFESQ